MASHDTGKLRVMEGLVRTFASLRTMEINSGSYAWNVVDPRFTELHALFCESVKLLFAESDRIARRIRALDYFVPATPGEFAPYSLVADHPGVTDGSIMLQNLFTDGLTLSRYISDVCKICLDANDQTTLHMLVCVDECLSSLAWKVKSHLATPALGFEKIKGMEGLVIHNKLGTVGIAGHKGGRIHAGGAEPQKA